jgi:four helix bundle protein
MKNNIVRDRSIELAVEIIRLYIFLTREKHEYILSKQLLRAGTSVGANIAEGSVAPSKRDFCNKLSIAYKESRETEYWMTLLIKTGYLSTEHSGKAGVLCGEVNRLLFTILRTATENQENDRHKRTA